MAVSAVVLIEAADAAAAVAQCSEIIFASVTAKLLSAVPELAVALALSPMRATLWPRNGLRSTLPGASLKLWPVLFSAKV
jgi:hypothetical protein